MSELEIPHVPSPYAGKKLRTRDHVAISSYWFATNFHWGALLTIMLPHEIKDMSPLNKAETVGLLSGVSAIVALLVPLLVGMMSDRCTSPWGRRRPFMLTGIGINVLGLVGMAIAYGISKPSADQHNVWTSLFGNPGLMLFFLAYIVVQLGNNVTSAAYMGFIPDLVPEDQHGVASGYMALKSQLGTLLGAFGVALLLKGQPEALKFALLAVVLVGIGLISVFGIRETPLRTKPPKVAIGPYLKSLWISPREHPDFAWVWLTRALVMLGFYAIQPFVNYYLIDVAHVKPDDVEMKAAIFLGIVLIASSISGIYGGSLSDRIGKKSVVYIANGGIAVVTLGFIFCQNLESVLGVGILFGLFYGAYISVDYALGASVLPTKKNAGKEMAVWHVAMTLPQTIAAPLASYLIAMPGKTVIPATKLGEDAIVRYTHTGYAYVFVMCSVCFGIAAYLLRNLKGVK